LITPPGVTSILFFSTPPSDRNQAAGAAPERLRRAYRFVRADKTLLPLTEDHSLLNDYLRAKKLTPEEIANFPHKNVITRALGMSESVAVDLGRPTLAAGDVVLLCCDGLSGMVTDEAIAALLAEHEDLDGAAKALIDAANAGGGIDNITCILIRRTA